MIVENRELLTVDEEAIKAEARELMEVYQLELAKSAEAADRLEPHYREMYLRSATRDVKMNRWVGANE